MPAWGQPFQWHHVRGMDPHGHGFRAGSGEHGGMPARGGTDGGATLCPHGPRQPRFDMGRPGQPMRIHEGMIMHRDGTCGSMQMFAGPRGQTKE